MKWKKWISFVLATALSCCLLPTGAWAQELQDAQDSLLGGQNTAQDMPDVAMETTVFSPALPIADGQGQAGSTFDRTEDILSAEDGQTAAEAGSTAGLTEDIPSAEDGQTAAEDIPSALGDYAYQELEDGTIALTEYKGTDTAPIVPSEIDGKIVSTLLEAFNDCSSITNVTLPNSLTSIGSGAFWGCASLKSITVPESVASISDNAFRECINLTDIALPQHLDHIGFSAFWGCQSLKRIDIPDGVTYIDTFVFAQCSSLTHVTLPDSVTAIGNYAFYQCSSLSSLRLSENLATTGWKSFYQCYSLTSIAFPKSMREIGPESFYDCRYLTSVTFSEGLTHLKDHAFYHCSNLTSISLPESLESMDGSCFCECIRLVDIKLPSHLDRLPPYAFAYCLSLKSITLPESITYIGYNAFSECSSLESVTLPSQITSISSYTFYNCENLKGIQLPDSVTAIKKGAFYGCSSLADITFSSQLESIGDGAFYKCTSLTSLTFPDSLTSIGYCSFFACTSLNSITLSNSLTLLDDEAFSFCALQSVTLPYSLNTMKEGVFMGCIYLSQVTIPSSVTVLGPKIFLACSSDLELRVAQGSDAETYAKESGIPYSYFTECAHDIQSAVTKEPDCTKTGVMTYTCSLCGYIQKREPIEANGHKPGTSETMKAPTCSAKGLLHCVCAICGSGYEEAIPATGHHFEEVIQKATHYHYGSIQKKCTSCDATDGSPVYIEPARSIQLSPDSFTYTGSVQKPSVVVKALDGELLKEGEDYTVSYPEGMAEVGTYTVTIQLTGNYEGEVALDFIIAPPTNPKETYTFRELEDNTLELTRYNQNGQTTNIPNSSNGKPVTRIGDYAFFHHAQLSSVTIPKGVTAIGASAFEGCKWLTSVKIPEGVTAIGKNAFAKCPSLNSIALPKSASILSEGLFQDGSANLTLQVFPDSPAEAYAKEHSIPYTYLQECPHQYTCQTLGTTCVSNGFNSYTCTICGDSYSEPILAKGHQYKTQLTRATATQMGQRLERCAVCGAVQNSYAIFAVTTIRLSTASALYNGKSKKPAVIVKNSQGKPLQPGKDYTVSYPKSIKNVGRYTITIKLQGNYMGSMKKTFTILPKATAISKVTSKKNGFKATWKKLPAQITGYEIAYSASKNFPKKSTVLLDINKRKTSSASVSKLKPKKKYYIRIRTYKTVTAKTGGGRIYSKWSGIKSVTTKKR